MGLKKKQKLMIEALKNQLGVITSAAILCKISRATHYVWMNESEDYRIAVEEIPEITNDFVENALLKQIKEGNTTAIIFYCKTKMKGRGYIEKQELEVTQKNTFTKDELMEDIKKTLKI